MRELGNVDFSEYFCARKIIVEFKRSDRLIAITRPGPAIVRLYEIQLKCYIYIYI